MVSSEISRLALFEIVPDWLTLYRGYYMSPHVLLNLLNELGEKDKMRGCAEHLIGFPQLV